MRITWISLLYSGRISFQTTSAIALEHRSGWIVFNQKYIILYQHNIDLPLPWEYRILILIRARAGVRIQKTLPWSWNWSGLLHAVAKIHILPCDIAVSPCEDFPHDVIIILLLLWPKTLYTNSESAVQCYSFKFNCNLNKKIPRMWIPHVFMFIEIIIKNKNRNTLSRRKEPFTTKRNIFHSPCQTERWTMGI